jgi:hypothetical protein
MGYIQEQTLNTCARNRANKLLAPKNQSSTKKLMLSLPKMTRKLKQSSQFLWKHFQLSFQKPERKWSATFDSRYEMEQQSDYKDPWCRKHLSEELKRKP